MDNQQKVLLGVIEDEMKLAYVDYAMSVIVGRALPDVRDGLKPVHRRILWAMKDLGLGYTSSYKKSARIVGETLGKYHPHGDSAVYDSLVRMAQDFSLRYPLVNGQGNFGSIDGDSPAAMRYCVTGDTLVVTEKGLLPIKKITPPGASEEENITLSVLSKDKQVYAASKWFDSGKHPTLKLTTRNGHTLIGTHNHPVLTLTKDESGRPKLAWKLMENLKKGDIVVIDRAPDNFWPEEQLDIQKYQPKESYRHSRILPEKLDENLAFILGSLTAEGSLTPKKIEFCNTDIQWVELFRHAWESVFPDSTLHYFKRKPNSYGKKEYYRLECHCLETIKFLKNIGLAIVKSGKRLVPSTILQSPKEVVATFLRAYFEGDGSISHARKSTELSCCSTSEKLLEQIQVMLLRFGISTAKRYDKYRSLWKIYIRGQKNRFRFYQKIGFLYGRKKAKLERVMRMSSKIYSNTDYVPFLSDFVRGKTKSDFAKKHNFDRYINMQSNYEQVCASLLESTGNDYTQMFEYLLKNEYLFDAVAKVEEAGLQKVYSIKVESDCHSFITNGIISHNTEAKMERIADEMLQDIEKETINFMENFDGSLKEPLVLPSKMPNLLVNGSSGIAVGMATNIPPHNMNEICNACIALTDNPDMKISEIMEHVKGPDFPTGGIIAGRNGIYEAYKTGRGRMRVKSRMELEESKDGTKIIVTEIPYMVNKAQLIEEIARSVKDKKIEGISDLRDESDRKGMRIAIELKRGATPEVVQNMLLKHTRMTTTFGAILIALVDGEPVTLNLKQFLEHHIDHRKTIVVKRTQYDLRKAQERAHVLDGLLVALNNIDAVIKLIRGADSVEEAREGLTSRFKLSEIQANAILDMRLQKLAGLERKKIKDEHEDLRKQIKRFKEILASDIEVKKIIKTEYEELVERYGDERKTLIEEHEEELEVEDLIEEENMVVTMSNTGYIKRTPLEVYKAQHRGGKGIIGATAKDEDFVEHLFVASTHSYLLIFTDKGKVYWKKVYQIPKASRTAKGTPIINIVELEKEEKVKAIITVREFDDKRFVLTATRNGIVKKTNLKAYSRPRRGGIIALSLDEDDELVNVKLTNGNKHVILATANGMAVKFHESDARPIGRTSRGVRGARLAKGDRVIDMVIGEDGKKLLTVTENGYGKKTPIDEYRLINRGGKGVINIKTTERNGRVVAVKGVEDDDDIILISRNGILLRTRASEISTIGRNTQGVKIMRLAAEDRVISAAKVVGEQEEPDESE